jgi:hypothetical protein
MRLHACAHSKMIGGLGRAEPAGKFDGKPYMLLCLYDDEE